MHEYQSMQGLGQILKSWAPVNTSVPYTSKLHCQSKQQEQAACQSNTRILLQAGSQAAAEAQRSHREEDHKALEGGKSRTANSTAQAEAADAPLKPDQAVAEKPKRSGRQTKKTGKAGVQDEDKYSDASTAAAARPARGKKAAGAHVEPAAERTAKAAAAARSQEDVPEARPETKSRLSRGTGAAEQGPEEPDQGLDAAAGTVQPGKRSRGRPGKALAKESTGKPHQASGEIAQTAQQANKHGRPSRGVARHEDDEPEKTAEERPGAAQQAKRGRPRKGVANKHDGAPDVEAGEAAGAAQQGRRSRLRARAAAVPEGDNEDRTDSGKTAASVGRLAALTESQAAADTLAKVAYHKTFSDLPSNMATLNHSWRVHEVIRDPEYLSILPTSV